MATLRLSAGKLHDVDIEDLNDWLTEVEKSFNVIFADNELAGVQTFGELSDHIVSKLNLIHSNDCTTQQAFYKLRSAIKHNFQVGSLTPHTFLAEILPRRERIRHVERLEYELGFSLRLLQPPTFVTISLLTLMCFSPFGFMFSFQIGILSLLTSCLGFWLAAKFGKEFSVQTIGELVERIARTNYIQSRRDPSKFNPKEIEKLLADWLCADFSLSRSTLTREAKFTWAISSHSV